MAAMLVGIVLSAVNPELALGGRCSRRRVQVKRQGPIIVALHRRDADADPVLHAQCRGFWIVYNLFLDWKQVVLGFTYILGTWSLIRYHSQEDRAQAGELALQLRRPRRPGGNRGRRRASGRPQRGPYPWLFDYVQVPMQSTMFSLLAFFVASASYRAFRARTVHATLLLVAGCLVMLGPRFHRPLHLGQPVRPRDLAGPDIRLDP